MYFGLHKETCVFPIDSLFVQYVFTKSSIMHTNPSKFHWFQRFYFVKHAGAPWAAKSSTTACTNPNPTWNKKLVAMLQTQNTEKLAKAANESARQRHFQVCVYVYVYVCVCVYVYVYVYVYPG